MEIILFFFGYIVLFVVLGTLAQYSAKSLMKEDESREKRNLGGRGQEDD